MADEGLPVPDDCDKTTTPTQTKEKSNPRKLKTNPGGTKKNDNIAKLNVKLEEAAKLGTKGLTREQIIEFLKTIIVELEHRNTHFLFQKNGTSKRVVLYTRQLLPLLR